MKRSLFGAVALAAVALIVVAGAAAQTPSQPATGVTSNGFETNTAGWFNTAGTINQRLSPYDNPGDYADNIPAAAGTHFAGLERGPCRTDPDAAVDTLQCSGPYTDWGNLDHFTWNGPYTTQVDIYLDTEYAVDHPDVYPDDHGNPASTQPGDLAGLSLGATAADPSVPGTRFDFTSAINRSTPDVNGHADHLRDFGFNVSTGTTDDTVDGTPGGALCEGFIVNATTNVLRSGANPNAAASRKCINQSGWYTFKHSFNDENGFLKVVMEIIPVSGGPAAASWTITNIDASGTFGCNRYGWFSNQEIFGLPIDNMKIEGGCAAVPHIGVIAPTATTCQQYRDNGTTPMPVLDELLYTTKGTKINAVSPGVFFYYTKVVGGTAGQKVDITQENDATSAPDIPINQGQVVLYDAGTCKVVKGWAPTVSSDGTATGNLPTGGDFIIGVKYNPSALKGADMPVPTTVEYTFGMEQSDVKKDEATIDLVPKA